MPLNDATVNVSLDYQFVLPPGVYWLGDPALMFPGVSHLPAGSPQRSPVRRLADGTPLLTFRGQSATPTKFVDSVGAAMPSPTGNVAFAPAATGRATPDGAKLLALFEPTDVAVSGGTLTVGRGEENVTLTIGEPGPPMGGVWITEPYPNLPAPTNLTRIKMVARTTLSTWLPPGTYWVGDLRPNFDSQAWQDAHDATSGFNTGLVNVDGEKVLVAAAGRACGAPSASDGNVFPHTGNIGVMCARRVPPRGGVHTYNLPNGGVVRWSDGLIDMAGTVIDTRPAPEVPCQS